MIWRGIADAVAAIAGADGRRAILLSTDGFDTGDALRRYHAELPWLLPGWDGADDLLGVHLSSQRAANQRLNERSVQLYIVTFDGARLTGELRRVATDSGGRVIRVRRDERLSTVFSTLIRELHLQYLLGYDAPEHDGTVHTITVRTKRPGLAVRARGSYKAG